MNIILRGVICLFNRNSKIQIKYILLEIFIFIWLDISLFDLSPSIRIFCSTLIAYVISRTTSYLLMENPTSLEDKVKKYKLNYWILFISKIFLYYFLVYKISTSLKISEVIIKLIVNPTLNFILEPTLDTTLYNIININYKAKKLTFNIFNFIVKCVTKTYYMYPKVRRNEPTAYIIHDKKIRWIVLIIAWFNVSMRPWLFDVFLDYKSYFNHYYNYIFTKNFRIPKVIAKIISYPISFCISELMSVINAIPVLNNSKNIVKNFKESVSTLILGKNILICPNINYTNTNSDIKKIYIRFLDLEKYYMQQTGNHLAFVPIYINKERCHIYVGNAIYFNKTNNFEEEKTNVYIRLKEELSRIENL